MINNGIKKIFSSFVIAVYAFTLTAPAGFCITPIPTVSTGVSGTNRPVLRSSSNPAASTLKLEGDISITKVNSKINLSLRDSDVKQVLRMFADKAGLNIIFHESVKDGTKVTLDMVNMPLNEAFKLIMQVSNLTYYIDQNTMVIADADAAQKLNLAKQELMTVPVKYVDASVLADFLNKNIFAINKPGLSNAQIATTNPSANEILIFGTDNDYRMAQKIVAKFDKKPLEQSFIVNHSTPKEMSDLLCNVLLKTNSKDGGSSGGSGGGGGGGSGTDLSLGTGIVACQYNNSVTADSLTSLNVSNLTVTYFPQRGVITVKGGSAQQMQMVKDFIAQNDKKQPQAYLEVSILELNETGMRNFDNTWNIWSQWFTGSFSSGTTSTSNLYPTFIKGDGYTLVDPSTYPPTIKQVLTKYTDPMMITYSMSYVIENTKARVLANPKILITNGQESTIDLSSDYVKSVTSQVLATGGVSGATQKTYNIGNDEGIVVKLTPFISPEGYVTLNIQPKYATEKAQITTPSPDGKSQDIAATLLQRRNLELKNVRIKDGETLVIGGMIGETETKDIKKIPVLGDLPGVGMFFRNSDTKKEKAELVIMITPKIIKDSEDVVNNNPGATL